MSAAAFSAEMLSWLSERVRRGRFFRSEGAGEAATPRELGMRVGMDDERDLGVDGGRGRTALRRDLGLDAAWRTCGAAVQSGSAHAETQRDGL